MREMEKSRRQKIFLIDAVGAVVSALSLTVLYQFEEYFGMPKRELIVLISIAICLSICSATAYLANPKNWKAYLTIIALLNISYSIFTIYLVVRNLNAMTLLGVFYFAAETLVIFVLSSYELMLGRTKKDRGDTGDRVQA
jgi:hypothetical protein